MTDDQLAQVMDISRVIAPARRGAFLELLAARARAQGDLGPDSLHRLAAATLREFLASPRPGPWLMGSEDDCA